MAKHLLLIVLAGLFLGCAHTAGSQYNSAAVERIGLGQTTESDVVAMLGPPQSEQKLSNGTKVYNYAYGKSCCIESAAAIDAAQIRFYDGVAIYKWHEVMQY
ncbi:MAG: hypothetical protein ACLP2P_00515 [Desulfobaccales bacterium]